MAIMIPGWLQWLEWVAGTDWPEGNEDLQQQLGQDVEAVADQIRGTVVPAVERAVDAVLVGYPDGDGAEQIKQELDKLVPQLEQLADSYDKMGQSAAEHATQIRSNKLNGIIALAWLAAELAYAAFLGPAAPAAQAGALAATQIAFRWLGTRLLNAIGSIVGKMAISHTAKAIVTKVVYEIVQEAIVEVLQGTSQELAVQGLNMADGFQDHMKWREVGQNAAISAIAGGVGGGAGHGMHNLMGRTSLGNDRWGGMAKGAIVGAGAGLAGAGGAYVSTGAITGQWELDPRMLTGGALSGMGPSMVHGWRGSSDYGGGPMSNTRPTVAVGSMPGTNSAGAGDGSSAAGVANGSGAVAANGNGPGNTATAASGSQGAGAAADAAETSANTAVASSNGVATAGDGAATSADTSGQGAGDGSVDVAGDGSTNGADDGSVNVAGDGSTNGAGEGTTSTDETQFSATDGASTPNSESAAGPSAGPTTPSDPGDSSAEQPGVVADASTVPTAESGNRAGVPHSDNSAAEGQVHGAAGTQPPATSPAAVGPAASTTATGPHPSSAGTSNASPQSGAAASSPAQRGGSAAAQSSTSSARDRLQVQERQGDTTPSRQADRGTAGGGGVRASADTARAGGVDGSVPRVPNDGLQAGPTDSVAQQHVSDSAELDSADVVDRAAPANSADPNESAADQQPANSTTPRDTRVAGDADTAAPARTNESVSGDGASAAQNAAEVLPARVDPPTTAEVGHAKDALRQLGDEADETDLRHADHRGPDIAKSARAQARANTRWWDSLTEAQQRAMVRVHPEEIGNAPGLHPATVDTANRLRIARELDALAARSTLEVAEQKQLDNLRSTVGALADAQRSAAAIDPDTPVRVLAYDATRFDGQGRAAVAFGHLTTANHISWHVPGRGHSLSNLDAGLAKALEQFGAAAQRTRPGETVASVAWLGYDVPSNARQGFTTSRAREGAGQLVQDIASIDAVRAADADVRPTNKVVAHGYGVDVAEASGRRGGLSGLASDVALVTPHDESVLRPDRFGDDVRVFHGASSDGLYSRIDAEYTSQQGNEAGKRLFGLNLISADGVGAVAHRPPDTEPAAVPDADGSSAGDRRNNCAPLSLQAAARYSGNTDIAVLDPDSIGPEGMHWRALQDAAGAELTRVSTRSHRSPHDTIAEALRRSGGRSTALVVDEQHGPADEYGVGAHAYVMSVDADTGAVMVDDPRIGPPFEFDQENPPDVQATWGVFYGADGSPVRPLGLASGSADPGETSPDDPRATSGRPEPHGSASAVRGSDSASGRRDPGTMSTDRGSDAAGSRDGAAGSHDSAAGTGRDEAPTRPSRIGDSGETSEQLIGPRIARDGLLADVSITADDHRLVESARRALVDMSGGPPDFDSLIPDSDAADASLEPAENRAETNARWWHALSVPEQRALAVVHPDIIGRADGIPAAVRDEANRLSLGREISGYRDLLAPRHEEPSSTLRRLLSRASLDEQQRGHLRALAHIQQSLVDAEKLVAAVHPDVSRPAVRLLSYDGAQPRGRAVVAFGDVDTAASVSWHVFGVRSDADSLPETLALVRNAYETTARADQDVTAAAIAWLDYEVPGTDQQATGPVAEVGGARLASAVAGLHATREYRAEHRAGTPTQDHHLFGLRFGATVVSEAAAGARLAGKVTSLVLLGDSASGTGSVRSAAEFGASVRVYAASSSRDRIGTAGIRGAFGSLRDAGPGTDPTIESFGATRIAAEIPVEGVTATKKSVLTRATLNAAGYEQPTFAADNPVHSQYYWFTDQHTRQPTEGLANMGRIASGHGDTVVLAPHRTTSLPSKLWQRSLGSSVVDPESQRRVTFYDGTVDRDVVALPESADTTSLVRDALGLRGPGVRAADVMHSGHADDMTRARDLATDNARWWDSLSEGATEPGELSPMQRALVDGHPFEVGNAEGIPARVRDIANRLQLDRELRELHTRRPGSTLFLPRGASSITPLERQQMRNLLATREALGRSGTVRPGIEQPPVHLLSFDSLAFGGAGRAVVALGDVDTAEHVAWQVPGITTTVEKLPKRLQMARDPYEAMTQANPDAKIASIAWIGYEAPSGKTIMLETPSPAFAEVGGRLLARDVMGYHAARVARATEADGAPHIHLFGHSYGSTTTGYGAAGGRLSREVATITLVGSPGAGPVRHASEFGIGAENVFVAKVSYDPVTALGGLEFGRAGRFFNQGLGLNPAIEEFGAFRVPSQFPPIGPFGKPFPAHGAYFDYINRDTGESPESLQNFGLIATGRGAEVRRVLHRVVPENPRMWHRTFGWAPRDPEGQRSPGDGTRPYQPEGTPVIREPVGDQPATPRGDRPEIQGHRGGRGLWSENTLAGYAQTLDLGVDVIELDVGLTSDGIPVVSHEQRIDAATARDTGPTRFGDPQYPYVGKPIRELSLEQVRTLSTAMVQQKFAATQHAAPPGSRVPSLAEVAELADGRGVTLGVEVKTDPSWSHADVRALVAATVDTLSGYDVQYRILGFDWRVLDLAAELAPPGVERVGLISSRTATRAWLGHDPGATQLGRLRGLGAELVGPPRSPVSDISALARQAGATMLSPSRAMVTDTLVQHASDNDMPLVPYTVNDPNEMRALIDQGVDGIVTDFPDLLRAVLTEQSFEVPESTQPQPVSFEDPAMTHSSDTVSANDVAIAAAGNSGSGSGRGVDIGPAPGQPWDAAEQAVRDKGPASQYQKIAGSSYESAVFLVEFADHSRWVYKPISQMVTGQITVLPSGPIPREVAAYRRDLLLGFGLVPPTVAWTGRYGEGTLQELVRGQPGVPVAHYSRLHRDMQLALDYLGAERDGHSGNLMPAAGDARRIPGDLVSIDNEHKNPLDDDRVGIRSSFVVDGMNQPLHPQVLETVQRLDPDAHEAMLTELGIEPEAIAGELRRAQEIREEGMVTGREWSGKIRDVPRGPEQEPQEPTAEPDSPADRKPTLWQRMRNVFTPAPIPEPTAPTTDDGSGDQLSDAADRVIPVNDCAPRSLRTIVDLTGSDVIQVPDSGSVGLSGMSDARLEEAAGGRLENFGSRDSVAERLTALGPGAAVVVVEEYSGPADRHGVGAHAYVMTNTDGVVIVRDPGLGFPHTYQWGGAPLEVSGVSGIVFAADGAPARPVTGHEANPGAYSRTGIGASEAPRNPAERGEPAALILGEEGFGPKGEQQRLEAGSHTWQWLTEQLSGWPGDRLDDIGLEVADLVAVKLAGADFVRVELDEAGEPGARNVRITVADTVMEFVEFPPIPAWVVEAIAPVRHLALSTPEGPAVAVGFRRFQQISRALASFSDAGGTLEVVQDRIDHGLRHRSNVNRSRLHAMQHNIDAEYVSLRSEGDRAELTIYPFRDQDLRDGMRRLGLTGRGDAPIALDILADAIRDTLSERRMARVAETTDETSGPTGVQEALPTVQFDQENQGLDLGETATVEARYAIAELDDPTQYRPELYRDVHYTELTVGWDGRFYGSDGLPYNARFGADGFIFGARTGEIHTGTAAHIALYHTFAPGDGPSAFGVWQIVDGRVQWVAPFASPFHSAFYDLRFTAQLRYELTRLGVDLSNVELADEHLGTLWRSGALVRPPGSMLDSEGADAGRVLGGAGDFFWVRVTGVTPREAGLSITFALNPVGAEPGTVTVDLQRTELHDTIEASYQNLDLGQDSAMVEPVLRELHAKLSDWLDADDRANWSRRLGIESRIVEPPQPDPNAVREWPIPRRNALHEAHIAERDDWSSPSQRGVYKPEAGEWHGALIIPPSGLAVREIVAYEVSEMLDSGLVPTTEKWSGARGPGSCQMFVPNTSAGRPVSEYSLWERDMMAVLDYLLGSVDRTENYLTSAGGRIVAIDHAYCFPVDRTSFTERPENVNPETTSLQRYKIGSVFVADAVGRPLSVSVLQRVDALAAAEVEAMLSSWGIEREAIGGALARLVEIKTERRITGEAWLDLTRSQPARGILLPAGTATPEAFYTETTDAGLPKRVPRGRATDQETRSGAPVIARGVTGSATGSMSVLESSDPSTSGEARSPVVEPDEPSQYGAVRHEAVQDEAEATTDYADEPPTAREVADERGESGSINGGDRCTDGEPVDMATGDVVISADDVQVPGIVPLDLRRTHVSSLRLGRHFGPGWLSILDERLEFDDDGIVLVCADGAVLSYPLPETDGGEVFPESGPRRPLSMRGNRYLIRDLVNGTASEYAVPAAAGSDAVPTVRWYRGGRVLVFDTDDKGMVRAIRSPGGPTLRMDIDPDTGRVSAVHLESDSEQVLLGRYRYTDAGDLAEVADPSGASMRYAYDAAHRLVSWTDRNDVCYYHRYDEVGRCVAQIGTGGVYANAYVYGHDQATGGRWTALIETVRELDSSHPVDIEAALGGLQSMPIVRKIRAAGPVVSTGTDPDFGTLRVLTFRTDMRGNVWQVSAADGAVSTFERDSAHQLVRSVDPSGATVSYERDRYGAVTAIVGPDGATTTVQRGSWGEPIAETGPGGRVWTYETDTVGNITMVTAPDGAATRYEYQQQPNGPALRRVTAPNGLSTDIECDSAGLPIRVTAPGNRTWTYARDEFGRIGTITDPLGRATVRTWTPDGRPLQQRNPDGTVLRWSYDDEGNQLSHTNEAGQHSRTAYTVMDLPYEVGAPDGGVLRIGYDTQLQVTSVTNQKGLLWRYEYDSAGRLTAETDYNGARTSYAYDLAGRLHAKTNAVGQTTCYGYDAAGRIAEHTAGDEVTVYRYDQHGDLLEAANPDAVVRFSRDALGRVHTERINDAVVASSYDEAGNRTAQIVDTRAVPDAGLGWRTMFGYDDTGMLISAGTDDGARASETLYFGYDSAGHETARQVGAAQISRRYDQRDRIIAQHVHNSSGVIAGKAWSYRPDGYVTATDDVLRGPRHFELDTAGRVDAVAMPSSVTGSPSGHAETEPGTTDTEQYRYDAAGVLRFASTVSTSTSAAVGEMSDESVASAGTMVTQVGRRRFWYDAAGRLVRTVRTRISHKPEVFEFTHDAQGQIRSVFAPDGTRWRYGYDPFGRRVTKVHTDNSGAVLESTVYAWDGDHLVYQHNRTGTGTSSWCWTYHPDTGEPLAQHSRTTGTAPADVLGDSALQSVIDTEFHAIVTDLSGAPTELIDPRTGTVAGWSSSTLWGRTQWHGHAATDLRFAGQLFDAETGLHYNRYRYYNPVTATYTAPDPLGLEPNPASATAYVHNPHTWVDPLGLAGCGTSWWQRIRRFGPLGAARQEYVDSVRAITIEGIARIEAGESSESVAHWAVERRNEMKLGTRAKLPRFLNAWAERRNNRHYGHPVGPTFELLHDVRGKTPEEIIVSAGRTNTRADRLLGVHTDD